MKNAREVIAALPQGNPAQAVNDLTVALAAISAAQGLLPDQRFDEIHPLDLAGFQHTHAILREYLDTPRQKKARENELWTTAYKYWQELAKAYAVCLQRYATDPRSAVPFRQQLPVTAARALRALRRQLQWTRLRYAIPEAGLWRNLASIYLFAERNQFAPEAVVIYPDETGSVEREFLKALMQSTFTSDSLHPAEQDLATHVISHYSEKFVLSNRQDEGCTHWFDLKNPQMPARTNRQPSVDADVRYFGAGEGLQDIQITIDHMAEQNAMPADYRFEVPPAASMLQSVLNLVSRDWSGDMQAREHTRHKVSGRLTVLPGFKEILRTLDFTVSDSLDFTDQPAAESWIVEDISEGGFAAVISSVAGDWVEVGSLIGAPGKSAGEWRIGVVRRVTRSEGDRQRVGVQLLSGGAQLVRMHRPGDPPARMSASMRIQLDTAVLLTRDPTRQKEVEVLVRSGSFTNADKVEMTVGNHVLVLRPKRVGERNANCERVAFDVLEIEQ